MPIRRRIDRVTRKLSDSQFWSLLLGEDPRRPAFASDADRRAAWALHREELRTNAGTRPQGWWDYESPEPRSSEAEAEPDQLRRLGVLTPDEVAQIDGWRWAGRIEDGEER
jgi:hypothetical protein